MALPPRESPIGKRVSLFITCIGRHDLSGHWHVGGGHPRACRRRGRIPARPDLLRPARLSTPVIAPRRARWRSIFSKPSKTPRSSSRLPVPARRWCGTNIRISSVPKMASPTSRRSAWRQLPGEFSEFLVDGLGIVNLDLSAAGEAVLRDSRCLPRPARLGAGGRLPRFDQSSGQRRLV